jgi:hypothetical protein
MNHICKNCSKEFISWRSKSVFCSRSCNNTYNKSKKETRKCLRCNENYIVIPSSNKKFCSTYCGNRTSIKYKGKIKSCKNCNVNFYTNISKDQKFCKSECYFEYIRKQEVKKSTRKRNIIWINKVKKRDGNKCKVCNSTDRLAVHHIIPYRAYPDIYDLNMNGVTLCHTCHKKYDKLNRIEYGTIGKNIKKINNPNQCFMATIPHELHRYPTVGDYEWTRNGTLIIFVSETGNKKHNFLIFLHEYIEAMLCKFRGIKEEDITNFDIFFEMRRNMGLINNFDEPGDSELAPYKKEHQLATKIEMTLAAQLGVDWLNYEEKLNKLTNESTDYDNH